jgi:hypothetical protein
VTYAEEIYPLEVKAGNNSKAKSLRVYAEKFKPPVLSTTTLRNLKRDADHCNFPLYAIRKFPQILVLQSDEEQLELIESK